MHPPAGMSTFEFVVLASLRAAQLTRGCLPRVESTHKIVMTAQMEVADGKVIAAARAVPEIA
jgi:DNA-directed RNA polymerase subunit K/omega